jgi:protein gp37
MSEHSAIGWTDATWPIVAGCTYESPGCSNCWAVRDSWRLAHNPHDKVRRMFEGTVKKTEDAKLVWTGLVRPLPERLDWPVKWKAPRRIFVSNMSDLFHPAVPFEFVDEVYAVMRRCDRHTYQVLTKHAGRLHEYVTTRNAAVLANVWHGVTVEDQKRADERIPLLLQTPSAVRWISAEPLLEPVDLRTWLGRGRIDWIVAGGESAQTRKNTRSFQLAWARDLRGQCEDTGASFFMKQLGTRPLSSDAEQFDVPPAGRTSRYKWHEPQHWPEDLQVQQFPA